MSVRVRQPVIRRLALLTLGLAGVTSAFALFGPVADGSVGQHTAKPTVVTVSAGAPTSRSFTLSADADLPPGSFSFKVTSVGSARHSFKLCTMPVTSTKANSCYGVATKVLGPGQSQTLTATLIEPGRYEYLSTVAGQAAAGMKGLIGVGVTLTGARAPVAPAATTTDQVGTTCNGRCAPAPVSTAPTTKPPATESLVGNPTVGAPLFVADCGSCHTLAAAHTSSSIGPNLDEIAPLQEELIDYMTYGSDSMPAFGGELTGDQLNAVAAYVYSSTHS